MSDDNNLENDSFFGTSATETSLRDIVENIGGLGADDIEPGSVLTSPYLVQMLIAPTASTVVYSDAQPSDNLVTEFARHLISNSQDLDPEFVNVVEEDFWDLLA